MPRATRKWKSIAAAIACVLIATALARSTGTYSSVSAPIARPVSSASFAVAPAGDPQNWPDKVNAYVAGIQRAEDDQAEADRVAAQRVPVVQAPQVSSSPAPVAQPAPSGCAYESLIRSVFVEDADWAVMIAMRESGCRADAYNASGASGLFQLLGHENIVADVCPGRDPYQAVFDPVCNVNAAHVLYLGSGRAPWAL